MKMLGISRPILQRIQSLPGRRERGFWIRAVPPTQREEERQIIHGAIEGGRLNPPGRFAVLYASEQKRDRRPYLDVIGKACLGPDGGRPVLITILKVALKRVLDLSSAEVRRALGVTLRDLTHASDLSVPQWIGAGAHDARFEGVIYPRPQGKGGRNLGIFIDRVNLRQLRIHDAFLLSEGAEV